MFFNSMVKNIFCKQDVHIATIGKKKHSVNGFYNKDSGGDLSKLKPKSNHLNSF